MFPIPIEDMAPMPLCPRDRVTATATRRAILATAGLSAVLGSSALAEPVIGGPMNHVVLLGDSIFDNAAYVAGGPAVVDQLQARLPQDWRATLLAVDGSVIASVPRQLDRLPPDASHLVLSVGGNDGLRQIGVLDEGARSMAEALARLAGIRERFAEEYRGMLEAVLARRLPTAICTIYDPRFPERQRQRLAVTGLTLLNDAITREAFARGLPLLDLRLICSADADYANPIEPSVRGGEKIAAAIAALVTAEFARTRHSLVLAGPLVT